MKFFLRNLEILWYFWSSFFQKRIFFYSVFIAMRLKSSWLFCSIIAFIYSFSKLYTLSFCFLKKKVAIMSILYSSIIVFEISWIFCYLITNIVLVSITIFSKFSLYFIYWPYSNLLLQNFWNHIIAFIKVISRMLFIVIFCLNIFCIRYFIYFLFCFFRNILKTLVD